MLKFIRNTILLSIAVFAVLQLIEYAAPYYWANKGHQVKMRHWNQSDADFNTVFIGSSRTQMHVMPSIIDSLNGYKTRSINLGYGSTSAEEALHFTEHLIRDDRYQDISYILLEVRPIWFNPDNLFTARGKYILSFSEYQFMKAYWERTDKEFAPSDYRLAFMEKVLKIGMIRDLVVFHVYRRFSHKDDFLLGAAKDGFLNRKVAIALDEQNSLLEEAGADRALVSKILADRSEFAQHAYRNLDDVQKADELYIDRLVALREQAAANGIRLYFYPTIRFENTNVPALLHGVGGEQPFMQTANPDKYPRLYDVEWSGDGAHLNQEGARYYSELLGSILNESLSANNP